MFWIVGGAAWVWENTPHWIIFLGIALIVLGDVLKFANIHFTSKQDPYTQQLSSASHGAAFIVLAPLLTKYLQDDWAGNLPPELVPWLWPACIAVMALGLFKLVIGAARTRMYQRDMQLVVRAIVKILFGVSLILAVTFGDFMRGWDKEYIQIVAVVSLVLTIWLVVTGIAKLVLLLRPLPKMEASVTLYTMSGEEIKPPSRWFAGWKWE